MRRKDRSSTQHKEPVAGPSRRPSGSHHPHHTHEEVEGRDKPVEASPLKKKRRARAEHDLYAEAEKAGRSLDLDSVPSEEALPPTKKKSRKRKLAEAGAAEEAAPPTIDAPATTVETRKTKKKRKLHTSPEVIALGVPPNIPTPVEPEDGLEPAEGPPKKKKKKHTVSDTADLHDTASIVPDTTDDPVPPPVATDDSAPAKRSKRKKAKASQPPDEPLATDAVLATEPAERSSVPVDVERKRKAKKRAVSKAEVADPALVDASSITNTQEAESSKTSPDSDEREPAPTEKAEVPSEPVDTGTSKKKKRTARKALLDSHSLDESSAPALTRNESPSLEDTSEVGEQDKVTPKSRKQTKGKKTGASGDSPAGAKAKGSKGTVVLEP